MLALLQAGSATADDVRTALAPGGDLAARLDALLGYYRPPSEASAAQLKQGRAALRPGGQLQPAEASMCAAVSAVLSVDELQCVQLVRQAVAKAAGAAAGTAAVAAVSLAGAQALFAAKHYYWAERLALIRLVQQLCRISLVSLSC
jgi:hypothetical protein